MQPAADVLPPVLGPSDPPNMFVQRAPAPEQQADEGGAMPPMLDALALFNQVEPAAPEVAEPPVVETASVEAESESVADEEAAEADEAEATGSETAEPAETPAEAVVETPPSAREKAPPKIEFVVPSLSSILPMLERPKKDEHADTESAADDEVELLGPPEPPPPPVSSPLFPASLMPPSLVEQPRPTPPPPAPPPPVADDELFEGPAEPATMAPPAVPKKVLELGGNKTPSKPAAPARSKKQASTRASAPAAEVPAAAEANAAALNPSLGMSEVERILRSPRSPVDLHELFKHMVEWGASDLHLSAGLPPSFRIHGDIFASDFGLLSADHIMSMVLPSMPEAQRRELVEKGDTDYSIEVPEVARFRVNVMQQNRGVAAVFRAIAQQIPDLDALGLPPAVRQIVKLRKGLVLVTGPAGSGKSTTLAAMIGAINKDRKAHIITIEDPLEFTHESDQCLITHREIGAEATTFGDALRAAMREGPDIVLVGELHDLDTVAQAIKTADMGLLVFASLHTPSAAKAIDRLVDIFPAEQQEQIRVMLAESLKAVLAQQLIKRADGQGRVVAAEMLWAVPGLANLIRDGKTSQIPSLIQTGRDLGMQSMDQALIDLVKKNQITALAARERAGDLRAFQRAGIVFDDSAPG